MNEETKIKLQTYLDGELSAGEARKTSEWLTSDSEARLLHAELQFVKTALRGNETEVKLPETREFYWSKIRREIERGERTAEKNPSVFWWKPAYVRVAGGLAVTCALLMISFMVFQGGDSANVAGEVEGAGNEMGAITYRSEADRMTVVYLFDRQPAAMVDFE